jgi:hypothetical protein
LAKLALGHGSGEIDLVSENQERNIAELICLEESLNESRKI